MPAAVHEHQVRQAIQIVLSRVWREKGVDALVPEDAVIDEFIRALREQRRKGSTRTPLLNTKG